MVTTTGLVAGFLTAGIGSRLLVTASPFDSDGIRSHFVALLGSAIFLSLLASFVDIQLNPSLNFQAIAMETFILAVIGYIAGVVASYFAEFMQDNGILGS